ncbi:hypothetical protein, variant [Cryptococcus amylolentus CBS 6039]|uniref:Uncharacterized protein n=2 Tax=Cryptococcus amylolentus TaxID=104669 RepID=A0A1E3HB24_9TREE|nr:hypothetical protein, variant [Cryptococcus amylolentus CBS 6039]ODN73533.1 hypothetical protein, variant [Cryptococcus amylolentus CBS 6039]ODN99273.1 hypothetical protein I350_07435 [Cryptococcus amylolentus CBS 6273]
MTTTMDGSSQVTDDEVSLAETVVQSMVSIHFKANRTRASARKKRRGPMRTTRLETLLEEDDDEVDVEDDDVNVEESDGEYKRPIFKQDEEDEDDVDKKADEGEEDFCIV